MPARVLFTLVFAATIGSGIVGGIFYAFSSFVMPALGRLPPEQGAAAMNSINVTVITPSFLILFMGTALVCLLLAGGSLVWWNPASGTLILAGSVAYLVGCFGVTVACNVPLNEQLAATDLGQAAAFWPRYLELWTRWNHVRTIAPALSAALFMVALLRV
jgi:uncharacterized membrane protein